MKRPCPRCGQDSLSAENPFGMVVCQNCGWLNRASEEPITLREALRLTVRWVGSSTLLIFLAVMSIQLARWQNYSFEATYLTLRHWLGDNSSETRMEMGAICNTLEKFDCSVEIFREVVEHDPKNRRALANLAIAHARLNEWRKALPHFNAYFSLGGDGFDVMYWYGRTLAVLENPERGLDWYHYALAGDISYTPAAQTLVDELVRLERWDEALSVIGTLSGGSFEQNPFWQSHVDRILAVVDQIEDRPAPSAIRLSSFNGAVPMLPVRLMARGRLHFFSLSQHTEATVLDRGLLDENLLTVPDVTETVEVKGLDAVRTGYRMKLPHLEIGPWLYKDVPVIVCDRCQNSLGRSVLADFVFRSWSRNGVEFITMATKGADGEMEIERFPAQMDPSGAPSGETIEESTD